MTDPQVLKTLQETNRKLDKIISLLGEKKDSPGPQRDPFKNVLGINQSHFEQPYPQGGRVR